MTATLPSFAKRAPAIAENPFRILGLTPKASARDVEREGAKLLALLATGMDDVRGDAQAPLAPPACRTAERVRWAVAELRDPQRRAFHEFFWLSGEGLPVDASRVSALLKGVPLEWSATPPVEKLVSFFAGELVPALAPWEETAEEQHLREAVLQPSAPAAAPQVCVDDLDLGSLLELPGQELSEEGGEA